MSKSIILLLVCLLTGCDEVRRDNQLRERNLNIYGYPNVLCINGVVYYSLGHSYSAAFNQDSKVILCEAKP